MTVRPLRLPRITRLEADEGRRLHVNRGTLALGIDGLRLGLAGTGLNGTAPLDFGCAPLRVSLLWGDAALELCCPAALLRQVLHRFDGSLDPLETLPSDLAALLLEACAAPALQAWARASGRPAAISAVSPGGDHSPEDGLRLEIVDGARAWPLHLACRAAQRAAILDTWPAQPRRMDGLALPAVLRLGTTRLALGMVASLCPGDSVLLQTHAPADAPGHAMLVLAEGWTAWARRDANGWRLLEPPQPAAARTRGEWTMSGEAAADPEPAGDADEISITLSFELGRLSMTLGELRRLAPGALLELGRGPGELVEIAAHGRPIGRGELVEVEGAVAIRIVRLFDGGRSAADG